MGLDKFEIWVHDHILKNDKIRHFCYGLYQRIIYLFSPKFKFEGNVKVITPKDGYDYFFGYYDKCPWSDDGKYILALRCKNALKHADSIVPADIIRIDLADNNKIEKLATTHCWNVQQGCMAQWLNNNSILYNDFRNGKFCAIILNIDDKTEKIIDMPIYTLSSDKKTALSLDFTRLHRLRPGYGYANIEEKTKNELCPDATCIWKIDIETGDIIPLLKYTDFANFEARPDMTDAEHKVNHLMLSPNGQRFMVLHRWFKNKTKYTRLVTCNIDGSDMYNLSDDDFVSHCCWKNDEEILAYLNKKEQGKGYYLMQDKTHTYERLWTSLAMDGHPTYSYDGRFVVTDTYPDRKRVQSLYIMQGRKVRKLARVFSPFKYKGDTRCDLHPRWSLDNKEICFDSSYQGNRGISIVELPVELKKKAHKENKTSNDITTSIIIPCYNAEQFLNETLESLESQTRCDFEVVCINDGSTDNTLSLLQKWQNKGTLNINIIDKQNAGVSSARNDGIKQAKGKYILFLDSDDIYHEEFVERLVFAIENPQSDVAYCRLNRNYDNVVSANVTNEPYCVQNQMQAMNNLLYKMGEVGFYCYIYQKEKLFEKNIFFDIDTKFGEDREFNWKYLCHCERVSYIDMPLYWYRVNNQSATKKKASWRKVDLLKAVKRIEEYLKENDCSYSTTFNSYMYARAMWAVAKTFAISKDKELYDRLRKEYDVKSCMKITSKDKNKLVKLASILYLIHPKLFYHAIALTGK